MRRDCVPRMLCLCVLCVSFVSSQAAAATRWPAAARFCPAYIKTIGVPTFANRTTVFNLETLLTQKVRVGVHRPRQVPDRCREATGVDALLTGEVTAVTHSAGELHTRSSWPRATRSR